MARTKQTARKSTMTSLLASAIYLATLASSRPTWTALAVIVVSSVLSMLFSSRRWSPKAKHCIVTGGSRGLGLALARLLLSKGADVTIIARDQKRLDEALRSLRDSHPSRKTHAISADVSSALGARDAISKALVPFGGVMADAVFMCAGGSTPGFFLEQPEELLLHGMDIDYWTACWTARAAGQLMAMASTSTPRPPQDRPKLVFVSSTLGLMTFAGYATYAPAKYAIRGLAETLRSELLLFGIDVHCFYPGGILSPGFEAENLTKPELTKKIEGSDQPLAPEKVAQHLLNGIERGTFSISYDLTTSIFRASGRSFAPGGNVIVDLGLKIIGIFAIPIGLKWADSTVLSAKPNHRARLEQEGFFSA